jgi:lipoate---protein ligase
MLFIETGSRNPAVNLAFEEYFFKGKDMVEDVCILWQSEPVVVIGRFQNIWEETNFHFANEHNIQIIRRITGGGAVYQDAGNLCFSFILQNIPLEKFNKSTHIQPIVDALAQLGLQADVSKRNDLSTGGKKFSGNAMAYRQNRLLFHGTLLFDADLDILEKSLRKPDFQIESKAVKSVRSKVTNIRHLLSEAMDIDQFKQTLTQLLFHGEPVTYYQPTLEDQISIRKIVETKYLTWDWNYASNPPSTIRHTSYLNGRRLEIQIGLENGLIESCQLSGDLFTPFEFRTIEKHLLKNKYIYTDIFHAMQNPEVKQYLKTVTLEEITGCLMGY